MRTARLHTAFICFFSCLSFPAFLPLLRAQAWLPPQGEGVVSFVFQDQYFKYHMLPTTRVDLGPTRSRSMLVDVTYGVTDKVSVSVGLPWMATKYSGRSPHPLQDFSGPTPLDNGNWHSTTQDFRFDLRYNVTRNLLGKGIVVTPYVGSILPSHDYPFFAHAGYGRQLKEVQVGVAAAKLFEEAGHLLVQGRYGYGFTEKVLDISHNRSVASLEVGYFVTPRLRLMALSSGQRTHGGIDLTPNARAVLPAEQFLHHDQITRDIGLSVGAGASFSLTQTFDVYGSWLRTVTQRNGHLLDRGVTVGLSWSFSTRRAVGRGIARAEERSLTRCVCEKTGM